MRAAQRLVFTAVVGLGLLGAACGGGGDGAAANKAEWEDRHGANVESLSRELVAADATLNGSERTSILGACNLLGESAEEVRADVLPVPDAAVDGALKEALDAIDMAAASCLSGARSGAADDVEAAMALMTGAREAMDAAEAAIAAWT